MDDVAGLYDHANPLPKSPTPALLPGPDSTRTHLLAEAPALLRYYQTGNDAHASAKQSFWKSFVLPSAMRTFAELSVFGEATDVSSSVFYSALANSAFATQSSDPTSQEDAQWNAIGKNAADTAQHHLQNALRSESSRAESGQLLSATLSLALVYVSPFSEHLAIEVHSC